MKELNFERMEEINGGRISGWCIAALAGYGIALGSLAVATGGVGLAFAAAGYGSSIVGVIGGCAY